MVFLFVCFCKEGYLQEEISELRISPLKKLHSNWNLQPGAVNLGTKQQLFILMETGRKYGEKGDVSSRWNSNQTSPVVKKSDWNQTEHIRPQIKGTVDFIKHQLRQNDG